MRNECALMLLSERQAAFGGIEVFKNPARSRIIHT
jgi:hypothetical protein